MPDSNSFVSTYLAETIQIAQHIEQHQVLLQELIEELAALRQIKGRLFCLGLGGSAANASHAVNDFRKIVGIHAFTPTDNVSELTALANDYAWNTMFTNWLSGADLAMKDALLVLSVGGGNATVSRPLVEAIDYAQAVGAAVWAIVGRPDGYAARHANLCLVIPTICEQRVTPHAEEFQSILLHAIVSHPLLRQP